MSQTQTVLPTAKQPSSTRKTNGSTRKGFLLLLNRVGVTVDPRCRWSMNSVQPRNKKTLIKKIDRSHQNEMTHLKILRYVCPPNCCKVCMPLCCGIHSCWMLLLGNSVCLVKVNVPCYIRVTCYMPQHFFFLSSLSCHFSTHLFIHEVMWSDDRATDT